MQILINLVHHSRIHASVLAAGKLKTKIETRLIKRAAKEPKGIFDYKITFQTARAMVAKLEEKRHVDDMPEKHRMP